MKAEGHFPVMHALFRLWGHFSKRRRYQFFLLVALAFVMSFAELATIGAVIPFMAAMIAPEHMFGNPTIKSVFDYLGLHSTSEILFPVCAMFGLLGLASAGVRLVQVYANSRFAFGIGTELSTSMYRRTLYQPYERLIECNSSELVNGIVNKSAWLINNIILSVVNIVGGSIVMTSVILGLVWIQPTATMLAFGSLGSCYVAVSLYAKRKIQNTSEVLNRESGAVIKILQEGLGGIRDVLIGNNQEVCAETYRNSDAKLRKAQAYGIFITQSPRFMIEGLALCIVAAASYLIASHGSGAYLMFPTLAALALGAQRLLPVMQQIYNAVSSIRIHKMPLLDSVETLDLPLPVNSPDSQVEVIFERSIELKDVSFSYSRSDVPVLTHVNLVIRKGQRIGVIGSSGSGKSTLLDILMGLLSPSGGHLLIDNVPLSGQSLKGWQALLSHVPQSIFLVDGTVGENIALAMPGKPIDWEQVKASARLANIAETIEKLPSGYETRVGERGVMLSGGQRQRIGIARALYKSAAVIILDEATSALDSQTEQEVMDSVESIGNGLTFFIVAHRLSTLKRCDQIVELSQGRIKRVGSYEEIIGE